MKKVILAMVLILPFVFQSCKNDDEDTVSLAGTKWECQTEDGYTISLEFPDDKQFVMIYYDTYNGEEIGSSFHGTYTVSDSKVSLTSIDPPGYFTTGTINGNKLAFEDSDAPSNLLEFTKK
jgi:hypothetical protein